MAIQILPYAPAHEPLVAQFNARMAGAGSDVRFFDGAVPRWLPPGASKAVHREYYVAVEDGRAVRAGYCLKPQTFLLRGEPTLIASIQGPYSEGIVDRRYGLVAIQLFRDMQERQRLLFVLGASASLLAVLRKLRWQEFGMPLLIRVIRVNRFLRLNRYLRRSRHGRLALDALAATGLGALGLKLLQLGQRALCAPSRGPRVRLRVREVERFEGWADEIWRAAGRSYGLIADRGSEAMNALITPGRWPGMTILLIEREGAPIGWAAVRDSDFSDDFRFGALHLGSVVDSLAAPGCERQVIDAAAGFLEKRGADLIITHYSHARWIEAFKARGFLEIRGRRPFIASPALAERLGEGEGVLGDLHLTLLDGDGPLAL